MHCKGITFATGGVSLQSSLPRRFHKKMQALGSNHSWDDAKHPGYAGDYRIYDNIGSPVDPDPTPPIQRIYDNIGSHVDPDLSSPTENPLDHDKSRTTRKLQKTHVSLHKVLETWKRDASAQQIQAREVHDLKRAEVMRYTEMLVEIIERGNIIPDYVIGLAFGEASEENIQALASVSLRWVDDEHGELNEIARQQGLAAPGLVPLYNLRVPVVYINDLVASPNERQKGAGAELVHALVPWAKAMGRLVTLTPLSADLGEYYERLGFQKIAAFAFGGMVYVGHQEEHTTSAGLLLDML